MRNTIQQEGIELHFAAAVMWSLTSSTPRDNNNLQQANRKLERKVKEMKMQADEEHINLQSQRDQVDIFLTTRNQKLSRSVVEQTGVMMQYPTCVTPVADSETEDSEEADGRGRGGDRASGTR